MSQDLDAEMAVKSLALRLRDWGVAEPNPKARAFIDDLQSRGWKVRNEASRRQPPKLEDECPDHPGEWRVNCRAHAADRLAVRDADATTRAGRRALTRAAALEQARQGLAEARAAQCRHGATRCSTCERDRAQPAPEPVEETL